jgi:hypothetical protein
MVHPTSNMEIRRLSLISATVGCSQDATAYWASLKAANPAAYWICTIKRVMNYIDRDAETLSAEVLAATGKTLFSCIAERLSIPEKDVIMASECGYLVQLTGDPSKW